MHSFVIDEGDGPRDAADLRRFLGRWVGLAVVYPKRPPDAPHRLRQYFPSGGLGERSSVAPVAGFLGNHLGCMCTA
jgi:hypothetical protein